MRTAGLIAPPLLALASAPIGGSLREEAVLTVHHALLWLYELRHGKRLAELTVRKK
jgi:hypothetical protein